MLEAQLKEVPFFKSLGKKELRAVAQQTDELDVKPGKELATEGDFGHEFFVIRSGTAEVVKNGEHIRDLGPGDFFGEIALLEEERRTATVRATSPMSVIVMTRQSFRRLDTDFPEVHATVSEAIAARRETSAAQ
jgi:CRP/FNR family transcriptional regulator, cyclic AMP receptor protein